MTSFDRQFLDMLSEERRASRERKMWRTPVGRLSDEDLASFLSDAMDWMEYERSWNSGHIDPLEIENSAREAEQVKAAADRGREIVSEIESRPHLTIVEEKIGHDEDGVHYAYRVAGVRSARRTDLSEDAVRALELADGKRSRNSKMRRRRRNPDNIDVSNIDLRNLTWQELDKLNYDCYKMYERVEAEYDRREAEDYKKDPKKWAGHGPDLDLFSEFRRRNPDHVVDLTRRRRDIEFDKLLGAASFGPSDPLEQAAENLMNAAEDYCRVRAVPNPRRRMRLKRYY